MLGLVPLVLLVAVACGAFYYWLSRRGLAAEERENPQDRRRISLLTESLAYLGAIFVLAGSGVAVGQAWARFTAWGHVEILASIAMFFLAIGLAVLWITEPAVQRMIGVVWFVSAACAGATAGIAAHDVFGGAGVITALVTGIAIALYSAILWLVRRLELQMVTFFAGLTITVCAGIVTIVGSAGPWLVIGLGLWALGIGWVIVGWQYPQPLWSTVPLGTVIALVGPAFAVWIHGWVYVIGIATAAAAMAASVRVRNTTLLAAGTLALFGYITSAVVRYFHESLGLPATLAVCGVLLLTFAVIVTQARRAASRQQASQARPAGLHLAGRGQPARTGAEPGLSGIANAEHDEHDAGPQQDGERQEREQAGPEPGEPPVLHLPRAS